MIASVAAALPGWGGSQPLDPRRSLFQDTAMRFPTMRPVAHRKLARPLPCALLTHDIASPSAGSLNNAPSPPMDFSIGTVIHEYVLAA